MYTPPKPKRRGRRLPWLILIGALFAGGAFLVFGTDDNTPAGSDDADPAGLDDDGPAGPPTFGVGTTQMTEGLAVTLSQVSDPWISAYDAEQAADGRRLVAVEISIVNTTAEPETLLSQTMTKLVDGNGTAANFAFAGLDLDPFDGPVAPGMTRTGWVVFEMPADASNLALQVRGKVLAAPVIFDL